MIKNRKYYITSLIILLLCAITTCMTFLFNSQHSKANTEIEVSSSTIYPSYTENNEEVQIKHYINLTNITYFGITDNIFCYTLNDNVVYVYDLNTKSIKFKINHIDIDSIEYINCTDNFVFVSSNNQLFVFNLLTFDNLNPTYTTLSQVGSYKLIDIYFDSSTVLIGVISNDNKFKVLEFDYSLNFISQYSPDEEIPSNYPSQLSINNTDAYMIYGTTENNQNMICKLSNYKNIDLLIKSVAYKITDTLNLSQVTYKNDNYLALTNITGICLLNTDILFDDDTSNDYPTEYVYTVLENQPAPPNNAITTGYISKAYDIKSRNNILYVSDYTGKFIETFNLSTKTTNDVEKTTITAIQIILGSTGGDIGRFNGKIDYTLTDSNNIYIADTLNNRIQILDTLNNSVRIIDSFSNLIQPNTQVNPRNIVKDSYKNLFFIGNYDNTNNYNLVFKFDYNKNTLTSIIQNDFGKISDITIDTQDNIYLINATTNKLYKKLSTNTNFNEIELSEDLSSLLDSNSKITYLNSLDILLIYNTNKMILLNTSGEIVSTKSDINISSLTSDFNDNIFILNNNTISKYTINNNEFTLEQAYDSNEFQYYANIKINKENGDILAFNSDRSALEIINNEITKTTFNNPFEINKNCYLEETINPIQIRSNTLVYSLPYNVGTCHKPTSNIVYPVATITLGNVKFNQVIYNLDNCINFGYIRESDMSETFIFENDPRTIIAINKEVSIYTFPSINKFALDEPETLKLGKITRKSTLNSLGSFPISFETAIGSEDLITYYVVKYEGKIGFVNTADFTLKNESVINKLKDKNATIKILDDSKNIIVYDEDLNEIATLQNNEKIVVIDFNADKEYTEIYYYDEDLNEYFGLIKTKYIKMDKVNNTVKLVLYITLATLILAVILIIVYVRIKKNSENKNI